MSTRTVLEESHESEKHETNNNKQPNGKHANGKQVNGHPPEAAAFAAATIESSKAEAAILDKLGQAFTFKAPIKWGNVIAITAFHIAALIFAFTSLPNIRFYTVLFTFFMGGVGGFGVTGGVHRFWTHKSFKAKLPLRIILAVCYSVSGQNTIFDWVRDHRVHHKFSESDADPHNANRGFFFAHVGWLMVKKLPEVVQKGKQVDMSDVLADPVVKYHQKYFLVLKLLFCFILPTVIPVVLWEEQWFLSLQIQIVRYILNLNFTWCVNSAAHMWGNKPYDRNIQPVQNATVSALAMGEGWHNYHHVFPWDYKAAEFGNYSLNITTFWIDLFAKIGWAYDLKEPTKDLVRKVAENTGDGSHEMWGTHMAEVPIEENDKYKSN